MSELPTIIADTPLAAAVTNLMRDQVNILSWQTFDKGTDQTVQGVYTFGHPQLDGSLLDRFPNIKVISNYGVGVDHISIPDAHARGILVGNTPGILNGATADMAIALMLAAGRRLAEGDRYARSADFTTYDPAFMLGQEIHGRTLGIFGMGGIGQQIAKRALAFDMRVIYHNRSRADSVEQQLSVNYVSKEELLQQSDYVMLSLPLNNATRNFIGEAELQTMKRSAVLVNVARGGVVDTAALTEALSGRQIYSAGLDVTEPEPLPRDHPLLSLPNVTITPHLGSASEQTRQRMAEISVENLRLGLAGEEMLHTV